jgi:plastocyanin
MKARVLMAVVAALAGLGALRLPGGTITGTIQAKGPPGTESGAGGGSYGSLRYKFAEKVDYDHMEDFVIYIDQPLPAGGELPAATVTQRNVSFEPRILAVAVGTKVRWPNADTIYHNVFSLSEAKSFDLGLYARDDPHVPELVFDKAGRIDVFCGIHSKMHCIVLVLPSPYFAKVNSNQRYFIRGVPAGAYKLKAWHERLKERTIEVNVPAEGQVRVDITLGLSGY